MDADDTFDEFQRVAMTGAAALSRAAEVLIRSRQDTKGRETSETARVTEDLQRRAEAQSQVAERYYGRTAEPGWVRGAEPEEVAVAWKGAQQWAQVEPDSFEGHADALSERIRTEYGFDPHDGTAGGLDEQAQRCQDRIGAARVGNLPAAGADDAGVPTEALEARMRADYLTGYAPHTIAQTTHRRGASAASAPRTSTRAPSRGQGRGLGH